MGWESYGTLNADKSNAILICHFFSANSHAAGKYEPGEKVPGYWDAIIGPGKANPVQRNPELAFKALFGSVDGGNSRAAFDRRTVGEADAIAWADALGGLNPSDCAQVIRDHYAESTDWLMPAHVRQGVKRIRAEGFLVFDFAERYGEGLKQLGQWVREGKLKYFERVAEGLENAPQAFLEMLRGKNLGKQIVKLAEE